jgi:hypothetical protein
MVIDPQQHCDQFEIVLCNLFDLLQEIHLRDDLWNQQFHQLTLDLFEEWEYIQQLDIEIHIYYEHVEQPYRLIEISVQHDRTTTTAGVQLRLLDANAQQTVQPLTDTIIASMYPAEEMPVILVH